MLTQGVVLSDRYRLSERIATGGMGAVWKCTDTLLGREVAVKVLLPSLVADPEFTTRFHAEARMLAALRHPGIVQVHDFGSATLADGSQVSYLVMEYVDGDPLVTWIRRAGRLDPASTMSVVAQAAHALHAAHLAGIVHRDVKPGNLLVKRDGTVVLVDFGIARASTMAGITAAHTVLGTATFMSPEQAVGQPVSAATDVYALGAVAYFCLAGRPPFEGDNPLQVAMRHAQDEPPPLPPDTPPAVIEMVRQALAKRPRDRHPSALALAEAAQDARDSTLARLPAPPRPPWAVAGPAVPGPAVLPAPGPLTPTPSGSTPPGGQPPTGSPATPVAEPGGPAGTGSVPAVPDPGRAAPVGGQAPHGVAPADRADAPQGMAAGVPHSVSPAAGPPPGFGPPAGTPHGSGPAAAAAPGFGQAAAAAPGFGPGTGSGAAPGHGVAATPQGFAPGRAAAPGAGGGFGGQPGYAQPGPPLAGQPGPAWAVGAAGPRPGGHGSADERHAGSGMPPTLEEPADGRKGRGRVLALAGAAAVVLVAVLTAGAVALLSSPDDPGQRSTTLTGESAPADPGGTDVPATAATPGATPSRTGRPSRSPSATPSRSVAATPSSGAQPTPGDTGAPAPATSSAAAQQPNPYTAKQVCGSGYQVIDSAALTANGVRKGRVYLLYNTSTGTNCVVTLKDTDVGRATAVSAYLEVQGKTRQTESGGYKYYAGPVRASAPGVCVKWGGSTGGASYGSPFEHCD
ncbi:serine/threonine-protein kinase [Micromonospora yasonensis]|uniref:serine/threonine-protein kinase n=1 Tax=Micromonospora yasonensis TaxID=1128667 RepID=UPI0029F519BB|nr:protein kinase [Micromonospora yasonensis]